MKRYLRLSPFVLLVLALFVFACELEYEEIPYVPVELSSPTPYPGLEKDEAHARLIELFETNGGCRFPCWWGIVPGKTTWEEVHALLSPFMHSDVDQILGRDDDIVYTFSYYSYENVFIEVQTQSDLPVPDVSIQDVPSEYLSNLNLSHIFQTYGMPDGIYIRSPYGHNAIGPCLGEFEMFTYYTSKRFAVRYIYQGYAIKQTVRVCGLNSPSSAEFYVWAHSSDEPDSQKVLGSGWHPEEGIRPIEEVTEWTTESFYAVFQSGAGSGPCIVAPPFEWKRCPNCDSQCEKSSP